jgi:hypothetical protein
MRELVNDNMIDMSRLDLLSYPSESILVLSDFHRASASLHPSASATLAMRLMARGRFPVSSKSLWTLSSSWVLSATSKNV